ncbi:MAG: dihydrofolate reductase [Steroidobacteraceae bacterium]
MSTELRSSSHLQAPVVIVVAMATNGVIGRDGRLPWHLPADLAHFKRQTLGGVIAMGRRTYESIGRPLPGRRSLVLTRDASWHADGVERVADLDDARCVPAPGQPLFVIGGAQLYEAALPVATRLCITRVRANIEGDCFFPPLDFGAWREDERSEHAADERNAYAMSFVNYTRSG